MCCASLSARGEGSDVALPLLQDAEANNCSKHMCPCLARHPAPTQSRHAADKLLRWDALPVVLSGTSNGWAKNWVLTGQSGCVGLASSLQHLWVLGAGQTIFVEAADAVHAVRDDTVRGSWLLA